MSNRVTKSDVILIGAGIMSATLGTMLKELAPDWNITVFEKLSNAGEESSNEWNNAGTGHAALCELNYTSEKPDGTIDISKAINVNEQFQVSDAVLVISCKEQADPKSARFYYAITTYEYGKR
ncbi:putative malate:quinone oxidoreductase 1 [Lysinibacillus sphaericus]